MAQEGTAKMEVEGDRLSEKMMGFIEWDHLLVERAIFLAVRGTERESAYHAARGECYDEPDFEKRNRRFRAMERSWLVNLGLAEAASGVLGEWPSVMSRISRCILLPCTRPRDGYAELYQSEAPESAGPSLVVQMDPALLKDQAKTRVFMRHELMHISDMLEPAFQYDPSPDQFPREGESPNASRDRYRVLWDLYIDGRLNRRFESDTPPATRHEADFQRAFRILGAEWPMVFEALRAAPLLRHPQLLALARAPRNWRAVLCG